MIREDVLKFLDNPGKLLYLLREEGSMQFKDFISILNPYESYNKEVPATSPHNVPKWKKGSVRPLQFMSRGTIAKHLRDLKAPRLGYITQLAEYEEVKDRTVMKYTLTPQGQMYINSILKEEESPVRPDQFGLIYNSITSFFQERGLDEETNLPRIITMIARIDQAKFFKLPQTSDLFNTLFYIFQNMLEFSLDEGKLYFINLDIFCEAYNLSKIAILYNLELILKAELGFYRVPWENQLFFQKRDLIGGVLFNLIQNALEPELIRKSLCITPAPTFSSMAETIGKRLVQLQLIRPQLQLAFQVLGESLLIVTGLDRGFTRMDIADYWPPFHDLLQDKNGLDFTKKLFRPISEYEKITLLQKFLLQKSS